MSKSMEKVNTILRENPLIPLLSAYYYSGYIRQKDHKTLEVLLLLVADGTIRDPNFDLKVRTAPATPGWEGVVQRILEEPAYYNYPYQRIQELLLERGVYINMSLRTAIAKGKVKDSRHRDRALASLVLRVLDEDPDTPLYRLSAQVGQSQDRVAFLVREFTEDKEQLVGEPSQLGMQLSALDALNAAWSNKNAS